MITLLLYLLLNSNTLTLEQAIQQNAVQIEAIADKTSPHYDKPIQLKLQNKRSSSLRMEIPVTSYFNPIDTNYQSFMVTEPLIVMLAPNETKTVSLKTMCINKHKDGHQANISYQYAGKKGKEYEVLANFIQTEQLGGTITGQQILWTQSDDYPLDEILLQDIQKQHALVTRLAKLQNKPAPQMPKENDYVRNLSAKPQVEFSGNIQFQLRKISAVQIAMFNTNNVVIRELYNNPQHKAGPTDMEFSFDASVYQADTYRIKLICDGQIKLELDVDNY